MKESKARSTQAGDRHGTRIAGAWRSWSTLLKLCALVAVVALIVTPMASSLPATAESAPTPTTTPSGLAPSFVHLGEPNVMVLADAPPADLKARMHQKARDDVAGLLDQLR